MLKLVRRNNSGQTTAEYILLLAVIVAMFLTLRTGIGTLNLGQRFNRLLTTDFKHAYQYGHPKAKGYGEDGGPKLIPRVQDDSNFRIFLNPRQKR